MVTKNLPLASRTFHGTFKSVANLSNLGARVTSLFHPLFEVSNTHNKHNVIQHRVIQVLNHSLKAHSTYIWYPQRQHRSLSISIEHVAFMSIKQFSITYVIWGLASSLLDGYNLQPQSTETFSFGKDSTSCLIDSNTRS